MGSGCLWLHLSLPGSGSFPGGRVGAAGTHKVWVRGRSQLPEAATAPGTPGTSGRAQGLLSLQR